MKTEDEAETGIVAVKEKSLNVQGEKALAETASEKAIELANQEANKGKVEENQNTEETTEE